MVSAAGTNDRINALMQLVMDDRLGIGRKRYIRLSGICGNQADRQHHRQD